MTSKLPKDKDWLREFSRDAWTSKGQDTKSWLKTPAGQKSQKTFKRRNLHFLKLLNPAGKAVGAVERVVGALAAGAIGMSSLHSSNRTAASKRYGEERKELTTNIMKGSGYYPDKNPERRILFGGKGWRRKPGYAQKGVAGKLGFY